MKRAVKAVGTALPGVLRDALGFGGAGAVAYGFWQIFHPLGFIVGGGLLLAGAWLMARNGVT